ncbi:hypothetical protein B0H10DRAFT_57672 [Mycena sp. CBHHK59/15]|nr:hypothetical protein B0H10DRAFT_57672 [Mycena sp. CBHHK59/15]
MTRDRTSVRRRQRQQQTHALETHDIIHPGPILTLPQEIYSEIFVHCVSEIWIPKLYSSDIDAPMSLLNVCRKWRSIALATPALWTTFVVNLDRLRLSSAAAGDFEKHLETWCSRARSLPLSLSFVGHVTKKIGTDRLSGTITPYLSKVRFLKLEITVDDFFKLRVSKASLLQTLNLGAGKVYNKSEGPEPGAVTVSESFPVLRTLILNEGTIPPHRSIPWHQLTTLIVTEDLSIDDCLQVLRWAPSLVECEFRTYATEDEDDTAYPVSHARLTSLLLGDCAHLLLFLTLPALRVLQLQDMDDETDACVVPFLARSAPPLRKFLLRENTYMKVSTQCYLSIPGLTHLELHGMKEAGAIEFLNLLEKEPKTFLPNLEHLAFINTTFYRVSSYRLLLRALRSRSKSCYDGPPVNAFRLQWYMEAILDEELPPLPFAELVAGGMDIYIGPEEYNCLWMFSDKSSCSDKSEVQRYYELISALLIEHGEKFGSKKSSP